MSRSQVLLGGGNNEIDHLLKYFAKQKSGSRWVAKLSFGTKKTFGGLADQGSYGPHQGKGLLIWNG